MKDGPGYKFENPCPPALREVTFYKSFVVICLQAVLSDLAKVNNVDWKMLFKVESSHPSPAVQARGKTAEEEKLFARMVEITRQVANTRTQVLGVSFLLP